MLHTDKINSRNKLNSKHLISKLGLVYLALGPVNKQGYHTKQTSELLFVISDGKVRNDNVPVQTTENKSAEGGTNKP